MSLTHIGMIAVSVVVLAAAWLARRRPRPALIAGVGCWVVTACYFIPEVVAISASTVPYDPLYQPMSALGVTSCGDVSIAEYPVCSPLHDMVNWVFLLNGLTAAAAAILLHRFWPRTGRTVAATWLLVVFGLSNAATGLIPADVDLQWHVIVALPSMVVQVPALLLLASVMVRRRPSLAVLSTVCAGVSGIAVVLLLAQPVADLPGGALQRVMYGAVWLWGIIAGLMLARRRTAD